MPYRKTPLVNGEIYHVFSRSIAGYVIFNSSQDFERALKTVSFYTHSKPSCKFSLYNRFPHLHPFSFSSKPALEQGQEGVLVKILAYCLMPTHIHLVLQQREDDGISRYINLILKSYSKYFNLKYKRKGPLWETRFRNVLVKTDEQFLHLTRYVHLNPVTASLVEDPLLWQFSSYQEYLEQIQDKDKICDFKEFFTTEANSYSKFVLDHKEYQKNLSRIRHLTLE